MTMESTHASDDRNKRRVNRYEEDETYREQQRQRSRDAYHAKHSPEFFDPRVNLDKLDEFGGNRQTNMPDGTVDVARWVFTKSEVAEVLGVSVKGFYLWINDGRFPKPILTAVDYPITRDYKDKKGVKVPQTVDVYTADEVKAAISVLGKHLSKVKYYRKDHTNERSALYRAIHAARKRQGLPEETDSKAA